MSSPLAIFSGFFREALNAVVALLSAVGEPDYFTHHYDSKSGRFSYLAGA